MSSSAPDVVESSRRAGKGPAEQEAAPAMSSSAPDVSRRAGKEPAEQEAAPEPQREWVALVSAAELLGNDDPRVQAMGTDSFLLDYQDPPLPSYLVLSPRMAPFPRRDDGAPLSAYILAADRSACLLLQVMNGNRPDFFLCNTHTRSVAVLSKAPLSEMRPHRSIGLITDPHNPGHYVLAQLHVRYDTSTLTTPPVTVLMIIRLLWYSTSPGQRRWRIRALKLPKDGMRNPFSETGVLAHGGRLWWLALGYGLFSCDPCTPLPDDPELRYLPLPEDCEMLRDSVAFHPGFQILIDQRRSVRPSEGKLRFVEIRGLSYDKLFDDVPAANPTFWMWTLDNPEAKDPKDAWKFAYQVTFAEIWDSETYADEGLPRVVPHIGLVDPNNHFVVYFLLGPKLFGFDMNEKKVVACEDCVIDPADQIRFGSSRPIVDAWEVPPPLSGDDDDDSPDDNVWSTKYYDKQMKVTESVLSWLNEAHLEWTRDTDPSVENWRAWQMAPPSSDQSSVNSGGQADDEQSPSSP